MAGVKRNYSTPENEKSEMGLPLAGLAAIFWGNL
jgi:hypothetical protein